MVTTAFSETPPQRPSWAAPSRRAITIPVVRLRVPRLAGLLLALVAFLPVGAASAVEETGAVSRSSSSLNSARATADTLPQGAFLGKYFSGQDERGHAI